MSKSITNRTDEAKEKSLRPCFRVQGHSSGQSNFADLYEFFLHNLDIYLEERKVKKDGTLLFFYVRYADDMLFEYAHESLSPKGLCKEGLPSGITLSQLIPTVRNFRLSSTFVDLEMSPKLTQGRL
jgi:hypothetical protein